MPISSVIKKVIMSVTGLFLCGFLIIHLSGNLMLLKPDGGATFNEYAVAMGANPLILIAEFVLAAGFLFHIIDGIALAIRNKGARKKNYAVPVKSGSWASKNMPLLGVIILVFLVIHLANFTFPFKFAYMDQPTLYDRVVHIFTNEYWYSILYIISMAALAFHLDHGFQSAFQTLGLNHPKYTPYIKGFGTFFAVVVPALFALIPAYFLFLKFMN